MGITTLCQHCSHILKQFPARWIGRESVYITWPARSRNLTSPEFFLWGFKDQVYRTPVYDLADLQVRIYAAVNNVTQQMLHNTWVEFEYRLEITCWIELNFICLVELRPSGLLFHSTSKSMKYYRARWLRGNARDSHSGGPGFKSRCRPTWLSFIGN